MHKDTAICSHRSQTLDSSLNKQPLLGHGTTNHLTFPPNSVHLPDATGHEIAITPTFHDTTGQYGGLLLLVREFRSRAGGESHRTGDPEPESAEGTRNPARAGRQHLAPTSAAEAATARSPDLPARGPELRGGLRSLALSFLAERMGPAGLGARRGVRVGEGRRVVGFDGGGV